MYYYMSTLCNIPLFEERKDIGFSACLHLEYCSEQNGYKFSMKKCIDFN